MPDITANVVPGLVPTELGQLIPGGPPTGPEWVPGDCYRTALACLLGCPAPTEVPHFAELAEWCMGPFLGWHAFRLARQWLRQSVGVDLLHVDPTHAAELGVPYLATVQSLRGPWLHCTVAQHGAVIHDPSGRTDDYRSALILEAEVLVNVYDPGPDELVRRWAATS